MQTMTRQAVAPTARRLRAEAARLEARARELEALSGEAPRPVPPITAPAPISPAARARRAEAVARGRARRRRMQALRAFARGVARVAWAIVVGVVAGTLMYLLATAGLTQFVHDAQRDAPPPSTSAP